MAEQNILDKSMRSVFVGNIPYEATEEKLKDVFNEVGPVISFKLVYDRETGKPKGYGFCEYKDQETALSAMRNLNGYEINGRTLRVDNACTEKSRLEMQSLMMGMPTSETFYGDAVDAQKAPEIINGIMSSLPPEQMYDLMRQMKECIHNNPVEARNMLLQNPQLGYALLQAQVIMKIVDPAVAKSMMHSQHKVPPPITTLPNTTTAAQNRQNDQMRAFDPTIAPPTHQLEKMNWPASNTNHGHGLLPNLSQLPPNCVPFNRPPPFLGPPELSRPFLPRHFPMPFRDLNFMNLPPMNIPPPGIRNLLIRPPQNQILRIPQPRLAQSTSAQPRSAQPNNAVVADPEKASLIMQVLQLTDAQLLMLPPEQRQSIMELKDKITLSQRNLF